MRFIHVQGEKHFACFLCLCFHRSQLCTGAACRPRFPRSALVLPHVLLEVHLLRLLRSILLPRFPLRPSSHKMTTPLYPNNCKQWLKADGSLEKWNPKDAGQMSFVVFQLKAQTCMCPQHATFAVLVRFVRRMLTRHCLLLPLPMLPFS